MTFNLKVAKAVQTMTSGGVAAGFFGIFQGRCTFAAVCFSIAGLYGWLVLGRDLASFAAFAGAMQALLVVRSATQDYHERQQAQKDDKQ